MQSGWLFQLSCVCSGEVRISSASSKSTCKLCINHPSSTRLNRLDSGFRAAPAWKFYSTSTGLYCILIMSSSASFPDDFFIVWLFSKISWTLLFSGLNWQQTLTDTFSRSILHDRGLHHGGQIMNWMLGKSTKCWAVYVSQVLLHHFS